MNILSWRSAVFLTFLCLNFLACGGSSDEGEVEVPVAQEPLIVSTVDSFGLKGNLWKPRADEHSPGPGNLVVLLSAEYTQQFDACEVTLSNGQTAQLVCINNQPWTQTPFSCFSNGNRQTWRGDFKCSAVAEVKVTCRTPAQEVVFTVPETVRRSVCSRFG